MLVLLSAENKITDTNFKTPPIRKRAKEMKLSFHFITVLQIKRLFKMLSNNGSVTYNSVKYYDVYNKHFYRANTQNK